MLLSHGDVATKRHGPNSGTGTLREYNAVTGAAINASFITGLNSPPNFALLGNNPYVSDRIFSNLGVYNATTGAPINTSFIFPLNGPFGLAISGDNNLWWWRPTATR
jgi:hypothetical protein